MSRTREAFRLIAKELREIRAHFILADGNLLGIEVALGEFHYDVQGQAERQAQELTAVRERLKTTESKLQELERAR